jgi:hypothetical protein
MAVDFLPQPNDTYVEDVSALAAGTKIIGQPCQVWEVIVTSDTGAAGIIQFSDDSATYSATHRKFKVYMSSGQYNQTISFPHGLNCTRGLCATSNIGGVDVFASYD